MAVFLPSIEQIQRLKVPPTKGEWTLIEFLRDNLDDSYEVYYNPYLNGDRPDVLIMRRHFGVMVIEVKDWNIDLFEIDAKKRWIYKQNQAVVKSPIEQVYKYKENLFDLHIPTLLELSINDVRMFKVVSCAVYFHCASQKDVNDKLIKPFESDRKYLDFLKHQINLIGSDGLNRDNFFEILQNRYMAGCRKSFLFTDSLYDNFRRILSPPLHMTSQGTPYTYSSKQKEIIYSTMLEQRVKGVFGSGKTTVLAARAVQAYKRALNRNPDPKILILTFNITLKNFIHDKLQRVEGVFPLQNFIIVNYHHFLTGEMNNLGIVIRVPEEIQELKSIPGKMAEFRKRLHDYLEKHYYANPALFEEFKKQIRPYDAVLIDEIQDYKREWMDIIKTYFRDPNGDYVLFGDVKQNIYSMPVVQKDVATNVSGRPVELKYCFRSDYKICNVAQAFQQLRFRGKYEMDEIENGAGEGTLGMKVEKEGFLNYMYFDDKENSLSTLYSIVRGIIMDKEKRIAPNDITVLGYRISLLRRFDLYYRYMSREKVNAMLETVESMYMENLNRFSGQGIPVWFNRFIENALRPELRLAWQEKRIDSKAEAKILPRIKRSLSRLLGLYELFELFPGQFDTAMEIECKKSGITKAFFLEYMSSNKEELDAFKEKVYRTDYDRIRENKKMNFWMNSGTIKVSTINSFKGWESELVFLIIEPRYDKDTYFNTAFDELLYTGITRSRNNLVVINFGNYQYDSYMKEIISSSM